LGAFAPVEGRDIFLVGSAIEVCDEIERWVSETDIDGLNLFRTVEPESLKSFCDLVVPELQNRGAFKTGYQQGTLRDKLYQGAAAQSFRRHPAGRLRHARSADAATRMVSP
jgi:hypothetical protein